MALSTRPTRLDYCQYLVSSQLNYALTNFAEHSLRFSHDQLNRYLRDDKLTPRKRELLRFIRRSQRVLDGDFSGRQDYFNIGRLDVQFIVVG